MNDSVKQRLIGAIVLLIICASIWPIVFPKSSEPEVVIESLIPEPPPLEIFKIPKQEPVPEIASVLETIEQNRGEPQVVTIDPVFDESFANEIAEKDHLPEGEQLQEEVSEALAIKTKAWAVQIGAFSTTENAENLAQKMREKKFSVTTQRRVVNGKGLVFVYLGPYLLQSQANGVLADVKQSGVDARLVEYKP